jgi:mono/diheme cytochrome c family protein
MTMPKYLAAAGLLLAFDGTAAPAQDAGAGHALASRVCRPCHAVDPGRPRPRLITIGPSFVDIANTKGMTPTALYAFLETPHAKMPNLILSPEEAADVIAYIRSLRQ